MLIIKRRQTWSKVAWVCSVLILLSACAADGEGDEGQKKGKLQVVTTIAQIGEPLAVIGGDAVEVKSLMGPGVDPHMYKATQRDINALQEADLVVYNGLHLEGNMLEVFEGMKAFKQVVAVGENIDKDRLLTDELGNVDPHIWFDIDLWQQALSVAVEEMKGLLPQHANELEARKESYFKEMEALKEWASQTMAQLPPKRRVLVTAHDAFGYFGRAFDLEVVGLQGLSTEDEIGVADIQALVNLLVERKVPAVFVESSVNPDAINAVIEGTRQEGVNVKLGGELYSDALGEAGTPEGTYLGMYRHNVQTIYDALKGEE